MTAVDPAVEVVRADAARALLLHGKGLLADTRRRATPAAVRNAIERIGFVQVDTINVVARAHDHILYSRFDGYRPSVLAKLLFDHRKLFEHWTHDASVIPTRWLPIWRRRFDRYRRRGHSHDTWWRQRIGDDADRVVRHIVGRIRREGPLMTRDFADAGHRAGAWWGWRPQKAALEYLWRIGRLCISDRVNFHKVYDLTERVFPDLRKERMPSPATHREWACVEALDRLGFATAAELSGFMRAIDVADTRRWCERAKKQGRIVEVKIEPADGSEPVSSWAWSDWRRRVGRTSAPPEGWRLLSPFDPVIRDRRRALRLFGFDYRFEAFVPGPRRRYGYYTLPVLAGDRFVARLDPKLHRERGELEVKGIWWEPDVRPDARRRAALGEALDRFAHQLGADRWSAPAGSRI